MHYLQAMQSFATVTNIFLTVMVQSPSYGLKAAIMGPSILATDLQHTHYSHLSHIKWAAPSSRPSNVDKGATCRLHDPHFHTNEEHLGLMKYTIGRWNLPPHTFFRTKPDHDVDKEGNTCSEIHMGIKFSDLKLFSKRWKWLLYDLWSSKSSNVLP